MDNFVQLHLGKSGFRDKQKLVLFRDHLLLILEKNSFIQGALINRRSTLGQPPNSISFILHDVFFLNPNLSSAQFVDNKRVGPDIGVPKTGV